MIDLAPPPLIFPKPAIIRPAPALVSPAERRGIRWVDPALGAFGTAAGHGARGRVSGPQVIASDSDAITSNTSTHSYTATLSGAFTHIVLICGGRRSTTGTNGFGSLPTLDGANMTSVVTRNNGSNREIAGLFIRASTATAPAISVSYSSPQQAAEMVVMGVNGLASATAVATAYATANPATLDLNTSAKGIVFAGGRYRDGTATFSVVGLNPATLIDVSGLDGKSVSWWANTAAEAPRTVTITGTPSSSNMAFVAASFL